MVSRMYQLHYKLLSSFKNGFVFKHNLPRIHLYAAFTYIGAESLYIHVGIAAYKNALSCTSVMQCFHLQPISFHQLTKSIKTFNNQYQFI